MENQNAYRFRFFKWIIYSLLLVSFLSVVFIIFSGFNLNQFSQSHSGIVIHKILQKEYLPALYVSILIIDLILILFRKIWAFYIFYIGLGILIVLLSIQNEIDWVNLVIMILLLIIFISAHSKMHRLKGKSADKDENLE